MANIPLANIPNAPQTGNSAVMTDPSAIRTPNFRRGGAMIAEGVNMLRQEKLPAAAFDAGGMGAGLESLGNAGSNAASAFGDFAVRLGRANDEAQMAELDAIKTDLLTRFEEDALTKPADQWGEVWAKYDAQLADKASKLPMSSPLSASKRDMAVKSLRMQTAAEVRGKANKARVDSYRTSLSAQMERQLTMDDTAGATATNAKMLNLGLIDEGQRDRNEAMIFKANKQKVDAEMWGNIESDMMAHSQDAPAESYYDISNDLKEAIASKSYKSKFFSELDGEPASLRKALTMVEQYERDGMIDRYNEAITRVAAGEYGTEDEFRNDYGDRLEPTLFGKAIDAFNQSPEEQAKRIAQRPALVTAIDMYDPVTDTNSKEFDKLLGWVHSMPAGYQADLSQMLRDKKKDAQPKPSSALQAIKEREKTLFDEGKYGPVKDDEQWQAAKALQSRVIDKLDSWARANPQQAADALEVSKKHNEIKTQIYQEDLADDNQSNMTKPQPVDPADLSRRVLQDPRFAPKEQKTSADAKDPNVLKKVYSAGDPRQAGRADQINPNVFNIWDATRAKFPTVANWGVWGDKAHQQRKSDHNTGDAIDIAVTDNNGQEVAEYIAAQAGAADVKYIIHNRRIWKPSTGWQPYKGSSPHADHVHVSVSRGASPANVAMN